MIQKWIVLQENNNNGKDGKPRREKLIDLETKIACFT